MAIAHAGALTPPHQPANIKQQMGTEKDQAHGARRTFLPLLENVTMETASASTTSIRCRKPAGRRAFTAALIKHRDGLGRSFGQFGGRASVVLAALVTNPPESGLSPPAATGGGFN